MHMTTPGIVLREVDYKERDKILTLFTAESGRQTVSARGCRKQGSQLAAVSQLLVYSEYTLYEYRGRWSLKEGAVLREFRSVRRDLTRLALASYFAELMEWVSPEELPAGPLLPLLLNCLHMLDGQTCPLEQVKAVYELRLLTLSGFAPLLDACAVCGCQPEQPQLHLREGILHCAACRSAAGEGISLPLTQGALAALRHIVCGPPERMFAFRMSPDGLEQLGQVCEAFLMTQLERGFHTLDYFRQCLGQCRTIPDPQPACGNPGILR